MPIPLSRIRNAALALGLSLALGGCVVGPPGYYGQGGYYGGVVTVAPPAPRVEYYGSPPYPGDVWIAGYWRWGGSRYLWQRGHWSAPRAGYRWVPHRWEHGSRGWHAVGGRWARDNRGDHRGDDRGEHRGEHRGWRHNDH